MPNIGKEFYKRAALQEEYLGTNKKINEIKPLVSVIVNTYQHGEYIRQCLESILMQETSFPFEIIIGEDESTDQTRDICIEYANKYQDKIRLFLRKRSLSHYEDPDKNKHSFNAYFSSLSARGKYIAICEGDDYWNDKNKLNMQYVLLNSNDSYVVCTHAYFIEEEGKIYKSGNDFPKQNDSYLYEYSNENQPFWITQPLTCMYRNIDFTNEKLKYLYWRDMHFFYYLLKQGKGVFINKFMGTYRVTGQGMYTKLTKEQKLEIAYKIYKELYERTKDEFLLKKYAALYLQYLKALFKKHDKYLFTVLLRDAKLKVLIFYKILPSWIYKKAFSRDRRTLKNSHGII